ncbi:hypothetical protein VOLCADRAFT_82592 [Volvox carteri f. nagariensis]|uniref:NF-X1-type domain-containing protein n=1 Tax=Volvox carteri f. nagariensis TaxID=3068 RepID=D8U5W3_VOLCA|nr:uncharacterized protein VOLCADRAFT_82592 [Volvox carteri f. nagariensis]EFJ44757.1 hypothetical protein VOLCADRAFT_82592 [Volvox carteri f. nagariensis]|eukprot:XP_002954040.1 hypothetical protein VOLCADRAFT_82592 [Volvox carteri f. nagariensis]
MPRVGGNGPFRRGPVLSNNSSDDEAISGSARPLAAAKQAWRGSGTQSDQAMSALFEQYMRVGNELGDDIGKDQIFEQGLSRIRDHLTNVDSSCCLICLNHIEPTEAVWHCEQGCYTVLHLVCIQDWARSQVDAARAKAAARSLQDPTATVHAFDWGCPKCRSTYPAADVPRQYKCFCGKVTNPEFDPWVTPHSCGEICRRSLAGGCGHTCLLLCHPGPCPPCPLIVDASCYCGSKKLKQRCGHHEYSCKDVCGSKLDCGHRCPDVCHPGDCAKCRVMGEFPCRCGAEVRQLQCGDRNYQCARVCGKPLACGNHKCEKVCHTGACGSCPFSGVRTCPCGKQTYEGMSCTDKVPSCGETCGKLLPCGIHRCADRCHQGECTAQCRGPALKTCRCGKSQKEVLCFQEFTCERRCLEMRACGRHPCKRRCCDGNCPPCEEVCGRRLKCGNHKCPAPCHSGPCRPCPLTVTVTCACGATSCTLPCGAESKAEAPHCFKPCSVPRICRHGPQLPAHRCHYGPCPPCALPCATPLTCGHSCAANTCHDPPPPPVPDFKPPPPPSKSAVAAATAMAGADGIGGSAICVGGHGSVAMPCSERRPYRCNAPCGRPLQCGNHRCPLPCHAVLDGATNGAAAAAAASGGGDPRVPQTCRPCDRPCGLTRGCSHPCPRRCHQGQCPRCELQSRMACLCGKTMLQLPCHQLTEAQAKNQINSLLSCGKPCHRQLAFCTHPCKALCHSGPCPNPEGCSAEVSVRCACPNKRRAKWKCSEVQDALERAGQPRTYDDAQAPRLLLCDAECELLKAKVATSAQVAKGTANGPAPSTSMTTSRSMESLSDGAGGAAATTGKASKTRLTRAEREALAAKKEAERLRQQRLTAIMRGVMMGIVVALGLLLAWGIKALLSYLDEMMQSRWALDRVQ